MENEGRCQGVQGWEEGLGQSRPQGPAARTSPQAGLSATWCK